MGSNWRQDLENAAEDWLMVAGGEPPPDEGHGLTRAMLSIWPQATVQDVTDAFSRAQRHVRGRANVSSLGTLASSWVTGTKIVERFR